MTETKQLQLLRSTGASANFEAAKNVLTARLDSAVDGELVTASYLKGDEVRTLFAIKRQNIGEGETKKFGRSFFFDSDKTAEDVQAKIDEIMGEGAGTITMKELKDSIDKLNGADDVDGSVKKAVKDEADRAKIAEKANADAIAAMDLADTAVDGEFVTTVSQTDGKVTISRGKVASDKVTAEAVAEGTDTVAIAGTDVDAQIKSLGKTLKTVQDNAAKYKVVKLTDAEVTALGDANVKEAYQVVSYVGDEATATKTKVGEVIKIYKEGNLKDATLGTGADAQKLILQYEKTDGTIAEVKVDFAAIAFNAEFKDGLIVAENGEISVKVDAASETYLTVGADGIKLAGVKDAIDAAVAGKNVDAQGDDYITATAAANKVTVAADVQGLTVTTTAGADSTIAGVEKSLVDGKEVADKVAEFTNTRIGEEIAKLDATVGETVVAADKHVAVQVVETDGKVTAVNVAENDIASAKGLADEITRAKAAEDKIEASVGLAADGSFTAPTGSKNYIGNATTVMAAVEALDAQVKINSDAIANKLNDLDVADEVKPDEFVTAVSQADGKIAVTRGKVAAESVTLAEVAADGETKLKATNVQNGILELLQKMIESEKVSADTIAALVKVLGEDAVQETADGYKLAYPTDKTGILTGASSFSDADEKLAAAIATLNATKTIDCGTY